MVDGFGRKIEYLRISLTDKCNLRCLYCMPKEGIRRLDHAEVLTMEEILRTARLLTELGIRRIRLTGGEPLVRRGMDVLLKELGSLPAGPELALTTNGVLLADRLEEFWDYGLRSVNISLDTRDREVFRRLTGKDAIADVERSIEKAVLLGYRVKLNCVPIRGINDKEICRIAEFARDRRIDVRFIELMPIGCARQFRGMTGEEILGSLQDRYGQARRVDPSEAPGTISPSRGDADPAEVSEKGPAEYVHFPGFAGNIGFIRPLSHNFCDSCNRLRLTVDGQLKLCLYYPDGPDLKALLRSGCGDEELMKAMEEAVRKKPGRHHFTNAAEDKTEDRRSMVQIGG